MDLLEQGRMMGFVQVFRHLHHIKEQRIEWRGRGVEIIKHYGFHMVHSFQ